MMAAGALAAAGLAAAAGCVLLLVRPEAPRAALVFLPIVAGLGLLSLAVIRRQATNLVGWFFLGLAVLSGLTLLAEGYVQASGPLPGAAWLGLASAALSDPVSPLMLVGAFLYFPTGRLPSPRWRPVMVVLVVLTAITVIAAASPPRLPAVYGSLPNPLPVAGPTWLPGLAEPAAALLIVGGMALAVASLVVRYRRAGDQERAQIRWVGWAALVLALELAAGVFLTSFLGADDNEIIGLVAFALALTGVPVSMAIAITRYRLYEIDRLVSRTVTYTLVTGVLAAVYVLGVVGLGGALEPLAGQSDLAVAASTLAVAALFGPLRRRVQSIVDRRFNRRRYDAARTVERFGGRLRDQVDGDELASELTRLLADTFRPAHLGIWLRTEGARPWR